MAQPLPAPVDEHLTSPRPLLFPTDAEAPVSTDHFDQRTALYLVLRRLFDASAWVGSNQFVYFDASDPNRSVAPDVFLRRGGPNAPFESWKVWERGAPEVAIEIVSDSDAAPAEWEKKLAKYTALGVVELVRFEANVVPSLRVWDSLEGDLVERRVVGNRATSRVLGLEVVVVGATLRLEKDGVVVPTDAERADLEARRAAAEAERAAAEAERAAAEAERAAAETERLRAKLIAAGIDPDT